MEVGKESKHENDFEDRTRKEGNGERGAKM